MTRGVASGKPGKAIEFQSAVSAKSDKKRHPCSLLSLAALVAADPANPFTAIPFNLTITLSPPASSSRSLVPNPSLLSPSPDLAPSHERHPLTRHPPSFVLFAFANFP
jgi:hypothetical protein